MRYNVLYRGPLSSCNYGCEYCPFAKRAETTAELDHDRLALGRFVAWVGRETADRFGVLFTPWGEALIRRWYREAIITLSHMRHVERVVAQTNLSSGIDWVSRCRLESFALWATYHPTEVARDRFVGKIEALHAAGVRLSVGVVGLREHLGEIQRLRDALPAGVYLWVNAYKREPDYYAADDVRRLTEIDPHFPVNNRRHPSLGESCAAGETSFTVDGDGVMRRCHFVGEPIGGIGDPEWRDALRPRRCPRETCSCHIGYVYLDRLGQSAVYGPNVLERIPLTLSPPAPPRPPETSAPR